jgi:uncharacterized protein
MHFLDTSRIRTRFDERVRAADGTELSVDLYFPAEAGRHPILLNRTPADNNNRAGRAGNSPAETSRGATALLPPAERWKALAAQGYIVAAADVRGRGDSDGEFVPFAHEAADGLATIAWLRDLDECSGRIGLFGSGYGAFCAWAAAVADGRIDAIASISPFGEVGSGLVHCGGVVRLDWLFWMHLIGGRSIQPADVPPWPTIHRHLPLVSLDNALGRVDIWWREWMAHLDARDPFWSSLDLADSIAALNTPGLHITGWWDGQSDAARYYYEAACRGGAPQRLIVGPWDSAATRRPVRQVGGFEFGPRSVLDLDEIMVQFFRAHLRADSAGRTIKSRVFVTGRNDWIDCADPRRADWTPFTLYLDSGLSANTRCGDGALRCAPPIETRTDVITHNPAIPVEFQPLFVSFATGANPLGLTLDQGHVTARDEALVYTGPPLGRSLTVMGTPRVVLTVQTTAPDADVYVLLSDCFPAGSRDLHLSHAAIRLATVTAFTPSQPLRLELELGAVAHDFLAGHQIRLTVVPSLFPLYARNLHGRDYTTGCAAMVVDIELHHGPRITASLTLPVVGRDLECAAQEEA